ncbi:hypothetical protein [Sphingomonas sp. YL-JM2C]
MKSYNTATIAKIIEGASDWLRQDLAPRMPACGPGEETLAAMIAAALRE